MEHGWVLRVWHDLFLIYRIPIEREAAFRGCLLYTSDAADE